MKVSFRSKKRMVTDYFVYINGDKLDFFEALSTARAIDDRCKSVVITDKDMIRIFKENEIN